MKLNNTFQTRPAPYDRNGLDSTNAFNLTAVAPHGLTVRASYTVPALKRAILESFAMSVYRATAAAPAGKVQIQTDEGASFEFAYSASLNNTVGFADRLAGPVGAVINAGATVNNETGDASTGGTNDYAMVFTALQFDQ